MDLRVRIAESVPQIVVRGFDLKIYELHQKIPKLVNFSDQVSEWEFQCQDGQIRAQALFGHRRTFKLGSAAVIQSPAGFLRVFGSPYRGEIRLHAGHFCDVINHVNLEKYLDGLVNAEFSSKWSEEAVAAQVVAARSYAYYQMKVSSFQPKSYFDLDATVKDQVYRGSVQEDFKSSKVVEKTRGMILSAGPVGSKAPLKAFYHSTCGGMTELPEFVWGVRFPGMLRSVSCGFCEHSPRVSWSLDLKTREIADSILRGIQNKGFPTEWPPTAATVIRQGRLLEIQIHKKNAAGRVSRLTTRWTDGKKIMELPVTGVQLREWLGPQRFRSASFALTEHKSGAGARWFFQGRGNGHGVGMCQWGAKVMGDKGYSMAAILKHYYPDAVLSKLW